MERGKNFLEQVADYLIGDFGRNGRDNKFIDMSDAIVIVPNKRSALFLKTYLRYSIMRSSGKPAFMPRLLTMERLAGILNDKEEMSRHEQIFLLYDCYRKVLEEKGQIDNIRDFDRFVYWGEIILSDFEELNMWLVKAEDLYVNISRLKEISANYLDEEQKELIRSLWGDTFMTVSTSEFWNHIKGNKDENGEIKIQSRKFLSLWAVLGDLYNEFYKRVKESGMTTKGLSWREAAAAFKEGNAGQLENSKYYFAGLSKMTASQYTVARRLHQTGKAKFLWDTSSLIARDEESRLKKLPHFSRLVKSLPSETDFNLSLPTSYPDIEVIPVGSKAGQSKIVSEILKEAIKSGALADNRPDTAVIVPDETMLSPLLLSIPPEVKKVNLTIGLSFRRTPFASFIRTICMMQRYSRKIKQNWEFRREMLKEVSHDRLLYAAAPEETDNLRNYLEECRGFYIPAQDIVDKFPLFAFIFRPLNHESDSHDISEYLIGLVDGLKKMIEEHATPGGTANLEMLDHMASEIDTISCLSQNYNINYGHTTALRIFETLLNVRMIDVEGTPLSGLQILGVPEGRAIDFENLIFMGMNEKVFPRKSFIHTLIPENLRLGYGLPSLSSEEEDYTYYFYRAIVRAKNVKLLYDSRTGSFGAGEKSRFIEQLTLTGDYNLKFSSIYMPAVIEKRRVINVKKNDEVKQKLKEYKKGGKKYLSASALKTFKACPLKFYLQYIKGLREPDEYTPYISVAERGNIVHKALEMLFNSVKNKTLYPDSLIELSEDKTLIENFTLQALHKERFRNLPLPGKDSLVGDNMLLFRQTVPIISLLLKQEADFLNKNAEGVRSFNFKAAEKKYELCWELKPELAVNFRMFVDRIDCLGDGSLRFIDYKTGNARSSAVALDNLFNYGVTLWDAIFQVLFYCAFYHECVDRTVKIRPFIYSFKTLGSSAVNPLIIGKKEIVNYLDVHDDFKTLFVNLLENLFSDEDFVQCEKDTACAYCQFGSICSRGNSSEV